ncbi:flagellar basal body L-ring protein FlgH [Kordiimonas sp. SCSIO 12610]|uniref:flagellar basal body L-ring protein FlgH n=1 Tax=Kordiimonas sp. SCSIO 12610 TaxID=2829597 RepID=UPI00210C42A6|nr:flagellar basal body L-ring protein FlgH [Kordiimonas sp. SCSIO 12610]UTW54183.1 flagellar basal body L-ring protein FlgH [Kordiimonas sp. SCSIO 12610]
MKRSYEKQLKLLSSVALVSLLSACGSLDRIKDIGKEPDLTPITEVKAPVRQRSISVPLPQNAPQKHEANSLWRTGARAFFKDQRASNVGDLLTVQIDIQDQAQIGNTTAKSRTTAEDSGIENFLGIPQGIDNLIGSGAAAGSTRAAIAQGFDPANLVGIDSTNSYNGTGTVNRSETISLTAAVMVTEVLPNGNLVIQGRQEVRVNFEKRELLIAGIIRPADISSSNVIQHTQIAEARISYGGKGQLTDVQQPRYGTQLYDIIFPF